MKKLFKTLAVLAALGFGFVSCGDPEDDNDRNYGSELVPQTGIKAKFRSRSDGSYINFYENGTYIEYRLSSYGYDNWTTPEGKGTYTLTGTFEKGSLTVVMTHYYVSWGIDKFLDKQEYYDSKKAGYYSDYEYNNFGKENTIEISDSSFKWDYSTYYYKEND